MKVEHFDVYKGEIVKTPTTFKQRVIRTITLLVIGFCAVVAAMLLASPGAKADVNSQCQQQFWLMLGANTRAICDGPIRADGSWERARAFFTPAHYVPVRTSCYGTYYVSCTTTGGYHVDTTVLSKEVYIVTPETVLPDEPGHIG